MAETFRVLLSDSLAAQGIEVLKRFPQLQVDIKTGLKPDELAKIIAPYDALLIRSATRVTREVIDAADVAQSDRARRRGRRQCRPRSGDAARNRRDEQPAPATASRPPSTRSR